jgi:hypothetical protein
MTVHHQSQKDRIDAGLGFEWDILPPVLDKLSQIPRNATEVRFRRNVKSHCGIAKFGSITKLWAHGVNQDFLLEISRLEKLELLHLENVTATELSPLKALTKLQNLSVVGATKVTGLNWLPTTPNLRFLAIENAKMVHDLSPLSELTQLEALGLEGSMWTAMRVSSLAPLSSLTNLRFLFMTNLKAADKSLRPLQELHNLRVMECGNFFGDEQFMFLASALPYLRCQWLPPAQNASASGADG